MLPEPVFNGYWAMRRKEDITSKADKPFDMSVSEQTEIVNSVFNLVMIDFGFFISYY